MDNKKGDVLCYLTNMTLLDSLFRVLCAILLHNTVTFTVICALMILSQNEDEVQVLLSIKWSADVQPQKRKKELQKLLQTWENNHDKAWNKAKEYTVLSVFEDGRAVIRIKPPPGAV